MELTHNYVGQEIIHPSQGEGTIEAQTDWYFKVSGDHYYNYLYMTESKIRFADPAVQEQFRNEPLEQIVSEKFKPTKAIKYHDAETGQDKFKPVLDSEALSDALVYVRSFCRK